MNGPIIRLLGEPSAGPIMNDVGDRLGSPESVNQTHPELIRNAIAQHEGSLVRYAQHFVGDLESARDVVQDTFLQLCKQPPNQVAPHLVQWLFRVTRNRAIDVCRKESRMKLANPKTLAGQHERGPGPQQHLERQESAESLLSQLARLPENQQEVLRLKFQGGLSYAEIATVTGLSKTNVGFLLHRAIAKLRERVADA